MTNRRAMIKDNKKKSCTNSLCYDIIDLQYWGNRRIHKHTFNLGQGGLKFYEHIKRLESWLRLKELISFLWKLKQGQNWDNQLDVGNKIGPWCCQCKIIIWIIDRKTFSQLFCIGKLVTGKNAKIPEQFEVMRGRDTERGLYLKNIVLHWLVNYLTSMWVKLK